MHALHGESDGWRRSIQITSDSGGNMRKPGVRSRLSPTTSQSAFLTAWLSPVGEGTPVHQTDNSLRRLPPLGQPLQGCWSSPNLRRECLTNSDTSTASARVLSWRDGRGTSGSDAESRTGQKWPSRSQRVGGSLDLGGARKHTSISSPHRVKNTSVWQRWQVSVPSNRHQREEVLERDRQRQRLAIGGEPRSFASPARSHAASLFFAQLPCSDKVSELLPPGALRRVARPQTRQYMLNLPGLASTPDSGTGTAGGSKKSRAKATAKPGAKSGDRGNIDDLPDEEFVFDSSELLELGKVLDAFAALVVPQPASTDTAGGVAPGASSSEALRESMTTGSLTRSDMQMLGGNREGPMVLRPLFCRFLLASKVCGSVSAAYKYQECVTAFDEHAMSVGAFTGMPRQTVLRVLASILSPCQQGSGEGFERAVSGPADATELDVSFKGHSHQLQTFFRSAVPLAERHCEGRKRRLEARVAQMGAIDHPEELTAADENQGKLWPPLPPRCISERELPEWMSGVRQWEEELKEQSPQRLFALRAHTETVLLGEVLTSQLLEPEVLHFTTRFEPLFCRLFCAYADWPSPDLESTEDDFSDEEVPSSSPGHMSFGAFFRFCVDFGLFPQHASFEEIKQVYNDAEAADRVQELRTPEAPSSEEGARLPQTPQPSAKMSPSRAAQDRRTDNGGRREVVAKDTSP